ncbi:GAF domain-containing sensor histidine kinase [Aquabacterium sp. A7-Y]|uniref:GAF domain-containing sensor histidine kinase n=1 Tax=Aquabacterium sp. A7-Y TaxID=1349605 RepID=UPI00223E1A98|nr:GAF domain-containing sensor histidine kinase [Aquabacterium sp. A7-Y]MCW7539903.1 GAF domain-containing sensor histidine kinase [Aquabacterium sp. A7-Y]
MSQSLNAEVAAAGRIVAVPRILEVVCRSTGLGFAAVARVTEDRWIACAVRDEIGFGLEPGGELQVETTLCNEIRASGQRVVIEHVQEDPRYCEHHTPRRYGFQSYIAVPIYRPDRRFFGTLCAIDPRPIRLNTPETIGMFELFADLIGFHLDAQERLAASEAELLDERRAAELREQFIAVLGHDLRNPLMAIAMTSRLLQKSAPDAKVSQAAGLIQGSATRMAGIINNVLDFARGRLGGGLGVTRVADPALAPMLEQVVAELQAVWPDRVIRTELSLQAPVVCDSARIAQLFSNLLANALTHGDPAGPVSVEACSDQQGFTLSVANRGEPIPPQTLDGLFQPFSREESARPGDQGLGLGLYIASEIARAHGGSLEVASSVEETRFIFRMQAAAG